MQEEPFIREDNRKADPATGFPEPDPSRKALLDASPAVLEVVAGFLVLRDVQSAGFILLIDP